MKLSFGDGDCEGLMGAEKDNPAESKNGPQLPLLHTDGDLDKDRQIRCCRRLPSKTVDKDGPGMLRFSKVYLSFHQHIKEAIMMHDWKIKSIILVLVVALTVPCWGAQVLATEPDPVMKRADEPSASAMLCDIVLARPLGLAATALGMGLFFVSLPFSAIGGNSDVAFKKLVVAPGRFTFNRPLGAGTQPDPY